jgi:hypothetical protein
MGRFDALTHLEEAKDKQNAAEIPPAKKPDAPVPSIAKEKSTSLLANQQTTKSVNQQIPN